jgi:hypothetical protein
MAVKARIFLTRQSHGKAKLKILLATKKPGRNDDRKRLPNKLGLVKSLFSMLGHRSEGRPFTCGKVVPEH